MDEREKPVAENAGEQVKETVDAEESCEVSMDLKDMISSVVIALFGLYVLISGINMSIHSQQMSDTAWYGTPGVLPVVIGAVLILLSAIMFISAYRKGERINGALVKRITAYFKSKAFLRLTVAIGGLAIYVLVLFPNIPFIVATFVYLTATMTFFREKKYPIWKIAIIAAVFSVGLYLFFSLVAGVPLR